MMAFALVESFLIIVCLVFLSVVLPGKWFREGFSYKGFLIILVVSIASLLYQASLDSELPSVESFFLWAGIFIFILVVLCLLFQFVKSLQDFLVSVTERFTVFSYLYIPLGFVGLSVVIFRNLFTG